MSERALHCPVCPSDKNISTTMMTPSVEQWWDDSIWRETKWSERNLSSATFVRHKHHMDWPGIEPGSPRWEAGDYPPEPWHGLSLCWNSCECKGFSLYLVENTIRFNPLNGELNPICHLLALLGVHFLHINRIRVKFLTLRLLILWNTYSWCF